MGFNNQQQISNFRRLGKKCNCILYIYISVKYNFYNRALNPNLIQVWANSRSSTSFSVDPTQPAMGRESQLKWVRIDGKLLSICRPINFSEENVAEWNLYFSHNQINRMSSPLLGEFKACIRLHLKGVLLNSQVGTHNESHASFWWVAT